MMQASLLRPCCKKVGLSRPSRTPGRLSSKLTRLHSVYRTTCRPIRTTLVVQAGLNKGDTLTSFSDYSKSLKSSKGGSVSLKSFKGRKPVVLFFYPKAGTPGCTKEVQKFRDEYKKFKDAGAEVFGISGDSIAEQKSFSSSESLPYPLLVDEGDALRKAFGIKSDLFGALPGRQTFVIGKDGTCILSYNDQFGPEKHVAEALKALK